jgi:hypothetical protein
MHLRRTVLALALLALAAPAAAQPSGQDSGRSRSLTSAVTYLPLPTLSTTVVGRFTTSGMLVVDVGLDVPDQALRAQASAMAPRLRDALRTALSAYANAYYRDNTAPDPETIARLMQTAVDRTLGRAGARLLLSNVIFQRRTF